MRLPTRLLQRKTAAHKNEFGHIFILAGCVQFSGAALLCSEAAMRSGAGVVSLGIPDSLSSALIRLKAPEVILEALPQTAQATLSIKAYPRIKAKSSESDILIIGPGLSQNSSTQDLIRKVIANINKPIIIDADGLNALAGHLDLLGGSRAAKILTPHPGEMSRLCGKEIKEIQSSREKTAKKFVKDFRVTLVLKGQHTVIADYGGKSYINKTGNPGMATAGSGDVLCGIIGSFLSQGLNAFEAAKYAVYLHGLAGDLAAREKTQLGMVASDIIENIPQAIKISSKS